MISKELLGEVININVQTEIHEDDLCSDNILIYWEFDGYHNECRNINIYELAHKCKEWAKYDKLFGNSGYDLYTEHHRGTNYPSAMGEKPLNKNYNHYICFYNRHNTASSTIGQGITEPEAIFKACQWILDNKDSK